MEGDRFLVFRESEKQRVQRVERRTEPAIEQSLDRACRLAGRLFHRARV